MNVLVADSSTGCRPSRAAQRCERTASLGDDSSRVAIKLVETTPSLRSR